MLAFLHWYQLQAKTFKHRIQDVLVGRVTAFRLTHPTQITTSDRNT
ncbi:MAG: hypothetical protein KME40_12195 [Komarekiella atlantica HA4396-MV6]|nr:hypothetical protein [Komarekiella atlantica HA4396-MV6]